MQNCECEPGCLNKGVKRLCGHWACDACTDLLTELCALCVPVGEDEYLGAIDERVRLEVVSDL